jgi:hypothetical protein
MFHPKSNLYICKFLAKWFDKSIICTCFGHQNSIIFSLSFRNNLRTFHSEIGQFLAKWFEKNTLCACHGHQNSYNFVSLSFKNNLRLFLHKSGLYIGKFLEKLV